MDKDCKDFLYLYLQSKISEVAFADRGDGTMAKTEIFWRMFQWKIPSVLKPAILKIWEDIGIIKKIDRRTYQFKKTDFDINNIGKLYEKLGIIPTEK
jgi:hypothetical protein